MSRLARLASLLAGRRSYRFLLQDWLRPGDLDVAADLLTTMRWTRQLTPVLMSRPVARRVIVLAPHPDDEMIGPGGTLLKLLDDGAEIRVLALTSEEGEKGMIRRRESESVASSAGYELVFLGLRTGAPGWAAHAAGMVTEELRRWRPDAWFLPFLLDDHPDHREASRLTLLVDEDALPPETWAYQVYTPLLANVVVDITEVHERKAAAIRMWRESAMRSRDWAHFALGLNAFNSRLLPGTHEPRYAESFLVLPSSEYRALCQKYFAGTRQTDLRGGRR